MSIDGLCERENERIHTLREMRNVDHVKLACILHQSCHAKHPASHLPNPVNKVESVTSKARVQKAKIAQMNIQNIMAMKVIMKSQGMPSPSIFTVRSVISFIPT
jgi:hypothetical protein